MVWVLGRAQVQREDVVEVSAAGLLVDRALVQGVGVLTLLVDSEDVHAGQGCVEHLGRRLQQAGVTTVPAGTIQEQPMDIHTYRRQQEWALV